MVESRNEEERKTQDSKGGNKDCNSKDDARRLGAFAISGRKNESDEIRTHREICARRDPGRPFSARDTIIGGILRHLIHQARKQMARHLADIAELKDEVQEVENQINEWEVILQSLDQKINESPEVNRLTETEQE